MQFEDNQITLDLLEVKSTGIFSMVDEEIVVPRGSDESLLNKLMQKHAKHPSFDRYCCYTVVAILNVVCLLLS